MTWINGEWVDNHSPEPMFWCPDCPPVDLPAAWIMRYCNDHEPRRDGESDRLVGEPQYLASGEAGDEANRMMCDLIHRRKS